jgi:hypothetical protein
MPEGRLFEERSASRVLRVVVAASRHHSRACQKPYLSSWVHFPRTCGIDMFPRALLNVARLARSPLRLPIRAASQLALEDYPFLHELGLGKVNHGVYYGGEWKAHGPEIVTHNPATGRAIASVIEVYYHFVFHSCEPRRYPTLLVSGITLFVYSHHPMPRLHHAPPS